MGIVVFGQPPEARLTQHRVASKGSPAPEPGAEKVEIPRLAATRAEWEQSRRPELLTAWKQILGKLEPAPADRKWFFDPPQVREIERKNTQKYIKIRAEIALERDFWQPFLLLLPTDGAPKHPAVIAWTATSPDWQEPEKWWGEWLAERGFVVLTSWSHIRNYRDGTTYSTGAAEKVYERFGRWAGLSRMVWDVRQEANYLKTRADVDPNRIGFIGFSLSAKTAIYAAAFAPELAAVVAVDPHIALNGGTNYYAPWYMDWTRVFPDIDTPQKTVLSLLNTDPARLGLEHDHHELMALAAPKPLLIIGGGGDREDNGGDSDDRQSWGYVNRAHEIYRLLGAPDRLRFALTNDGHHANGPAIDDAWREWLMRWLH